MFPGDNHFRGCLTPSVHCLLRLQCFSAFSASVFKRSCECSPRLIHLCLFLDWFPESATSLPYLRGIPVSAWFQGIPRCALTPHFPFPFLVRVNRPADIKAVSYYSNPHKLRRTKNLCHYHWVTCFTVGLVSLETTVDRREKWSHIKGQAYYGVEVIGPFTVDSFFFSGTECTGLNATANKVWRNEVIGNTDCLGYLINTRLSLVLKFLIFCYTAELKQSW